MTRTMLMLMTLLVGCATGVAVRELVVPARAQGQTASSYGYQTVRVDPSGSNDDVLAKFGRQGWHLVTAAPAGPNASSHVLYFDRQLPAH
jgi:hypothetical protein